MYTSASSPGLDAHFKNYADYVFAKVKPPVGSLVVDVGSNDGTLLGKFKARGMDVLGVESAPHIAAAATAAGINTIADYFTPELAKRMVAEHGHAKLITANNVLANIDDLLSFAKAVETLIAPDGVFVFESSYLVDLVENMVFDFIYHEHISSFSIKPMQVLFKRVGLEVTAVQRVPTKGGSLRYFIQRPAGPLANDGSVAALRAMEDRIGLYNKATYDAFASKIDGLKKQTKAFLVQSKREGKRVAGFGASITGTTLIYHFEIGEYLDYLVDDNPAKIGRFSPGHHLPVLPTSVLTERKPDYVVVLAWRYAEAFLKKNAAYMAGGGKAVIPVPEFKVISGGLGK